MIVCRNSREKKTYVRSHNNDNIRVAVWRHWGQVTWRTAPPTCLWRWMTGRRVRSWVDMTLSSRVHLALTSPSACLHCRSPATTGYSKSFCTTPRLNNASSCRRSSSARWQKIDRSRTLLGSTAESKTPAVRLRLFVVGVSAIFQFWRSGELSNLFKILINQLKWMLFLSDHASYLNVSRAVSSTTGFALWILVWTEITLWRVNIPYSRRVAQYARKVSLYARAAVELDLYTVVSVSTTAILLAVVAHVLLQRPRGRSAARHKSRSSSTWSTRWTRSSPRLRAAVVVLYVSLRVVHALLLTFSVTSLLLQVIMINVIII